MSHALLLLFWHHAAGAHSCSDNRREQGNERAVPENDVSAHASVRHAAAMNSRMHVMARTASSSRVVAASEEDFMAVLDTQMDVLAHRVAGRHAD